MKSLHALAAVVFASAIAAQNTTVLPARLATTEGTSSQSIPWGIGSGMPGHRYQYLYGSANFTGLTVPINYPIVISRLRWRADGGTTTWTGGVYNQVRIDLSTAAMGFATPSPVFAVNHGQDRTTVINGPVTMNAQAGGGTIPGAFYIDCPFTTPFVYDPIGGDLVIDLDLPGGNWTGGTLGRMDIDANAGNLANRVGTSQHGELSGAISTQVGIVEVTYVAAAGLFPRFAASITTGNSPLQVQFTDQSISTNPGGVIAWAWDFDNDNVVDSTAQHPTHSYTTCGSYSVRLGVTDSSGTQSLLRTACVVVDAVTAAFTATPLVGQVPLSVQFTSASTGPVTGWAWDFDNDNVVDSTVQNPIWVYGPGTYSVRLTVTNGCTPHSVLKRGLVVATTPIVPQPAPDVLQYQFNEVRGQDVANTASTAVLPQNGSVFSANWQGDPGLPLFRGNETGAGMLASGPGRFVNCNGGLTIAGSMTVMWWQRQATASTSTLYAFGSSIGAGPRAFGTGTLNFTGSTLGDVQGRTSHRGSLGVWRHVALVIDDAQGVATWYVDGVADSPPRLFVPGIHSSQITELHVGYGSSATTGSSWILAYDMDDFRIYNRALGDGEILAAIQLAENPSAGTFGSWCDGPGGTPQIGATGLPSIGNTGLAVTLANAENARLAALVLGMAPRAFGTFSLASILGPGCQLEVDWMAALFHITASNAASQQLAIPPNPTLRGLHVYGQWLIAGTTGATSRAIDIAVK